MPARAHRHPRGPVSAGTGTVEVVALAVLVAAAISTRAWSVVAAGVILTAVLRRPRRCLLVAALGAAAVGRSDAAWDGLRPDALGPFHGWATVVGDPQVLPSATRVVVALDGERFEAWVRGPVRRRRAAGWHAGDRVEVAGERRTLDEARQRRVASQHVVGVLDAEWFGDAVPGDRAADASNRVRAVIARGAAHLPADRAALTRGLVIGDDRDEPPAMVQRFREAGLSHLTAVSGQNVGYGAVYAGSHRHP